MMLEFFLCLNACTKFGLFTILKIQIANIWCLLWFPQILKLSTVEIKIVLNSFSIFRTILNQKSSFFFIRELSTMLLCLRLLNLSNRLFLYIIRVYFLTQYLEISLRIHTKKNFWTSPSGKFQDRPSWKGLPTRSRHDAVLKSVFRHFPEFSRHFQTHTRYI